MDQFLRQLADKLGIMTSFYDAGLVKKEYAVDDSIIKFFCKQLGYKAGNLQEIAKSLDDFDKNRWQKSLEAIYFTPQIEKKFDIVVPESSAKEKFVVSLISQQDGSHLTPSVFVRETGISRVIGKTTYVKLDILVEDSLAVGYYDLIVSFGSKKAKSVLAVAPEKCYDNPHLEHEKLWGFTVQLYSLKSERNWGVGDFTDLQNLIKIASRSGANIIGLNPLNVLLHNYPEEASPYQSISRLYLNPIYIDVESVPEFKKIDAKDVTKQIHELHKEEYIDYTKSYTLKIKVLEKLYKRFLEKNSVERQKEYDDFCTAQGADLEKLAIFQSLYNDKVGAQWGGWRAWEEELQNPNSLVVKSYAKTNAEKVGFFKYLQFEADRQFNLCKELVDKSDLKIGLYRDLAVGVGQDSMEVWSDPELFIQDAGAGAPPDAFFPAGQKWGLGAFNPFALKDQAYIPFRKIISSNMKNAGGLRIDHVMSLTRLYVIPNDQELGTYIMYNFSDMLNIVAIESHLHKCVVVGESIGNVPEGFLDTLESKNINSISVIWAERWEEGWGNFKFPSEYPVNSFVSIGTHDMAPLRMWWFGFDIDEMRKVGIIDNDDTMTEAYKKREVDRWKILSAMDSNSVWPRDNMRQSNYIYGENYPEGFEEAVHKFMARTNSKVFLAELENILHVQKLQNLPGVDRDKHPNWRLKLPVDLEHLEEDIAYVRNVRAIRNER